MRFPPHVSFGLARNGCRWPIFARNACITLHRRQKTGAECYGTSADDRNTTSGSTGNEYSTSQMTGSTLLQSRGVLIVDVRVQTAVCAVSVKPEVVVSLPEVVLRDLKWLPPAQIYSDSNDAECEGVFCFDTVSITFVHTAGARIETRLFGRPLQVTL